jgi:hypothetical protein
MIQKPSPKLPRELRSLKKLLGSWSVTIRWSEETHKLIGGPKEIEAEAKISSMKEGFLSYQMGPSHWIIGGDESSKEFTVIYSDERLISRVYRMSFARGVWKIWRDAPRFHQRFEAHVRSSRRIDAHWDKSEDGKFWVRDFDMTFVRFN